MPASIIAISPGSPFRQPDPVAAEHRQLAAAIVALQAAVAEMTAAQAPIQRLQAIIGATGKAEATLTACRKTDDESAMIFQVPGSFPLRWVDLDGAAV
jgi:hypothetical protein